MRSLRLIPITLFAATIVIFLGACSSFSQSREQNLYQVHIGQSKAELRAALGKPTKEVVEGSTERWFYEVYSADNRKIYPYTATFENGNLAKWDFDTARTKENQQDAEIRRPSSQKLPY